MADVHDGLRKGLEAQGHEIVSYAMEGRIANAGSWLKHCWQRAGRPKDNKPGPPDVIYLASQGILERALRFEVDWTVVVSGIWTHPETFRLMRRAGLRVAIVLTESPYEMRDEAVLASLATAVFTNERTAVPELSQHCKRAYYLPHSYDPERHFPEQGGQLDSQVAAHDVVFVGTGWPERIELLRDTDWAGVDLGLYGSWELVGSRNRLRRHICGGPVDNAATAALYRRARVGLNLHRSSVSCERDAPRVEGAESLAPRALELAACGRFFLSDYRVEMAEVFGDLVPMFRGPAELSELVRYYLRDERCRERLAANLPDAVRGRTFTNAACLLIKCLEEE